MLLRVYMGSFKGCLKGSIRGSLKGSISLGFRAFGAWGFGG